ncbi:MAG: Fic family protein [candidate division Zixibacteria bacterium]
MNRGQTGKYITISTAGENCSAFIPNPLPPDPEIKINAELHDLSDNALWALGQLDGLTKILPESSLFLYMYVHKEAVLSSQIEGTQSSLSDLLLHESEELPGVPGDDDVQITSNYIAAMNHGLDRVRQNFPISSRLIREIHEVLLSRGRGSDKNPGEFRRSQNWIGGTRPGNARFVPPPPEFIAEGMSNLEKYIHNDPVSTPTLLKAAISHVQFETIHPFLDGNGRLGRLLITLLLCSERKLRQPMLYLSLFFKTHREEYYKLLQRVRTDGEWKEWVEFFMTGVLETSNQAVDTARRLIKLFESDGEKIKKGGRRAGSALRAFNCLQNYPVSTIKKIAKESGLSIPTVNRVLQSLIKMGIVREITDRRRNRRFVYDEYLKILSEGTEPIG